MSHNDICISITDATCYVLFSVLVFQRFTFEYTTTIHFLTNNALICLKHIFLLFKQYFIPTLTNNYKISQTVCLLCIHLLIENLCVSHMDVKSNRDDIYITMIIIHISFLFYNIYLSIINIYIRSNYLSEEFASRVLRSGPRQRGRQWHRHGYVCSHNHRTRVLSHDCVPTNIIIPVTRIETNQSRFKHTSAHYYYLLSNIHCTFVLFIYALPRVLQDWR